MTITIEWIPSYSVNHPDIDGQHQQLFQLIDGLPDVLDETTIKNSIMKLFKYTRVHFSDEETIMKNMDYPDLVAHQKLHDQLISKLNEFSDHEFSDEKTLQDFKEFAYDWLTEHIIQQDMKYHRFAEENSITW